MGGSGLPVSEGVDSVVKEGREEREEREEREGTAGGRGRREGRGCDW